MSTQILQDILLGRLLRAHQRSCGQCAPALGVFAACPQTVHQVSITCKACLLLLQMSLGALPQELLHPE